MADTTFVPGTVVASPWLNDVNTLTYRFNQLTVGAVNRTAVSKLRESVSVKDFGAVCDGVTDDTAKIQAALNSGAKHVLLQGTAYCTGTITVPQNVELYGDVMMPTNTSGVGPTGSILLFRNDVAICIHVNGGFGQTGGGTPGLRNVAAVRVGAPPVGSIGIRISGAYLSQLHNIMAYGHAIGIQWYGQGTRPDPSLANGLGCTAFGIYTGKISQIHLDIDSWPELRITQGRCGMNGLGDLSGASTYIRITSPTGGSGGAGPNTIIVDNVQFNQGGASVGPDYWVYFQNNTANVGNQAIYKFSNCHMENFSNTGAYIASDAASQHIQRMNIVNCTFNNEMPLFALNPATIIEQLAFIGCDTPFTTINIASQYVGYLRFVGCYFFNTVAVFSAPPTNNWIVDLVGNYWGGTSSVTVTNTGWRNFKMIDSFGPTSTWTNTSGSKFVEIYDSTGVVTSWTPTILLGGAVATGYVYTASGTYSIHNRTITVTFKISLSTKGSATGLLSIGNLPFAAAGSSLDAPGGVISYAQNFTGLTGQTSCYLRSASELGVRQSAANGTNTVTDVNLTTNTQLYGSITFNI